MIGLRVTKRQYLKGVRDFADALGRTPDAVLAELKKSPKLLPKYVVKWAEARSHLSRKSMESRMVAVKVWLELNDHIDEATVAPPFWKLALKKRKLSVKGRLYPARSVESREFGVDQIREAFLRADLRGKVLLGLMLTTGGRIGAVGGLRFRDFVDDLRTDRDSYCVMLRHKKGTGDQRERYPAFTTREIRDVILQYVGERERNGEGIGPNSPVVPEYFFTSSKTKQVTGKPLKSKAAGAFFLRLMKSDPVTIGKDKAGRNIVRHPYHPHLVRKVFRGCLSQAGLPESVSETLMGHKVPDEMIATYDRSLAQTEFLRRQYEQAIPFLSLMAGLKERMDQALEIEKLRRRTEDLEKQLAGALEIIQQSFTWKPGDDSGLIRLGDLIEQARKHKEEKA